MQLKVEFKKKQQQQHRNRRYSYFNHVCSSIKTTTHYCFGG